MLNNCLKFLYTALPTLLNIALMNHKNTAHQLFNISGVILQVILPLSFWKFAEHIKLYQMDYLLLRSLLILLLTYKFCNIDLFSRWFFDSVILTFPFILSFHLISF